MKPNPTADYPVRVRLESWEHDPPHADLFSGVFAVTLNVTVDIIFVPDLSRSAPPWDGRDLPDSFDELVSPEQAAFATAMLGRYVVTPNAGRAGRAEYFRPLGESTGPPGVVRYIEPAEYAGFADELDRLAEVVGAIHSNTPVSALRNHLVVRFIEREIVAAPWFGARDAAWLGRPIRGQTG